MKQPSTLDGRWQVVRAEFAGEVAPGLATAKITLEFSGERYAICFDGEVMDEGIFSASIENAPPATLLLSGIRGTNAGRTIPAIFQNVGDRLRVCFGFGGVQPTRFATAAGSDLYLATYRRISPATV